MIILYKNQWVLWLDSLSGKIKIRLISLSFGKIRAITLNQINMKFRGLALKYLTQQKAIRYPMSSS
ncbi:MAG: hypothetical protein WCS87_04920 [Methylococcaceae bacterium]